MDTNTVQTKKPTGLIIATIITSIIAICGIAGAIYFYIDANNKSAENANLRAKFDLVKAETGAELVEKEENGATVTTVEVSSSDDEEVKALARQIYEALNTNINTGRFYTVFGDGSIINIPDSSVYTSSDRSYGVTSASYFYDSGAESAIMGNAYSYVKPILLNNGFVEHKEIMGAELFYNSSTGVYCKATIGSLPYSVECSKDTWLKNENRKLSLALAKAADAEYIDAKTTDIENSPVSPYQKIKARGYNYAALFYRVSPDSDWQYFTGTQAVLSCSDYSSDAAKAFAGDTCWDEVTQQSSTVKP